MTELWRAATRAAAGEAKEPLTDNLRHSQPVSPSLPPAGSDGTLHMVSVGEMSVGFTVRA